MNLTSLETLLEEQIKDLYSAENQLVKALPKMAKAAANPKLKLAFQSHLEETRGHVERLRKIAEELGFRVTGKTCKAMQGLVEEGNEVVGADGDESVVDEALIVAAQRVEHYEISAYGSTRALAERLGKKSVVKLLQTTLDEEGAADKKLTAISEGQLLRSAPQTDTDPRAVAKKKEKKSTAADVLAAAGAAVTSVLEGITGGNSNGKPSATRNKSGKANGKAVSRAKGTSRASTARAQAGKKSGGAAESRARGR